MAFEFITDHSVLDFVSTVESRDADPRELLAGPRDLADWIRQAGLLDKIQATQEDLLSAQELREAAFGLVCALIDDELPLSEDRQTVNRYAAGSLPRIFLGTDGRVQRSGSVGDVLTVLARDCLALHEEPVRGQVKWCADPICTRPFVDRSRGHRRRWCGMKGCGDRAKAAAYRQRRRAVSGPRSA